MSCVSLSHLWNFKGIHVGVYTNKHSINQFPFVSTSSCDLIKLIHCMHSPTQVMQVRLNANNSHGNIGIFSTYTNSISDWLPLATLLISAYLWFFLVVFVKDQFRPPKFLLANSLYPYMALVSHWWDSGLGVLMKLVTLRYHAYLRIDWNSFVYGCINFQWLLCVAIITLCI